MILDYKNDKEFALKNGVIEYNDDIYFCGKNKQECEDESAIYEAIHTHDVFKDIVFKNFPVLSLNNSTFENCTFEECKDISMNECVMINCSFVGTDCVMGDKTDYDSCYFKDSVATIGYLLIKNNCKVDNCTFENIHVKGTDSQVCRMDADKEKNIGYLTNCRFINCSIESPTDYLSTCTYNAFFSNLKKKPNLADDCEIINNK